MTRTAKDYMADAYELAAKLTRLLDTDFTLVSYSGGVPGFKSSRISKERFNEIQEKLTSEFGTPNAVEPWHFDHTKGKAPRKWNLTSEMKHLELSHIQLISMMQRKDKQYLLVTFM